MYRTVFVVIAFALFPSLFATQAANAMVCPAAIQGNVTPSFGCEIGSTNNDQPPGQVNTDNLFGVNTWTQVAGPTNVNSLSGLVNLPADFWDNFNQGLLVLKGGDDAVPAMYVGYLLLEAGGLAINWDTPFVNAANQNRANVSHYTLYGTLTPVPLPPAILLFLTAVAGLGFFTRRRASAI